MNYISPKRRKRIKKRVSNKAVQISPLVAKEDYVAIRESFLSAVASKGSNERGEPIQLKPWYQEVLSAIADFRIGETYVSGIAQLGKSLSHTNLLLFCIEELGLNALWSYDLQASLNIQVPSNFRPVAEEWLKKAGKSEARGAKNNTIFQIGSATAQFTYVSTSATKSQKGKAAAGGIAVGVSRDIIFKEERSQYPLGADAPLARRMDAGRIPTKPVREFGTPGGGTGIEVQIDNAEYNFFPHFQCLSCGQIAPLHPKGCLLKETVTIHPVLGERSVFLSESGRPLNWFRKDKNNPVSTAYFGCPHCSSEIQPQARENAWYQCTNTGITLKQYLQHLPLGIPSKRQKVGITISALLKITQTNRAAEIIEEGLSTQNTFDWQQQMLGLQSETGTSSVSLELLKAAIASPIPAVKPSFRIGGIDCGRGGHWLVKMAIYLPPNHPRLQIGEILDKTIRHVYYAELVDKVSLVNLVQDLDYGLIDNEPERSQSSRFCSQTNFEMGDQRANLLDAVKRDTVIDGGIQESCWLLRNEKFLTAVRNGFLLTADDNHSLYRFPASFEKHLANLKSETNLFRHLMAVSQDPMTGAWERPMDSVDDFYYAFLFAEAALYIKLNNLGSNREAGRWFMS